MKTEPPISSPPSASVILPQAAMNLMTHFLLLVSTKRDVDVDECSIEISSANPGLADCRTSTGTPVIIDFTNRVSLVIGINELVLLQQEEACL